MSLTLGEKLRQAREERGFSLSEVAEQTRISSLYLESIENDDFSKLPGGIFNKGFVKSYAKFVGVSEQEALADYSALMARSEIRESDELKLYKPEVLTDDRAGGSMAPTIITAVVILALMTAGILFLLNYLQRPDGPEPANTSAPAANVGAAAANSAVPDATPAAPQMGSVKIEFKASEENIALTTTEDGKAGTITVNRGETKIFEPKETLKLGYYRSLGKFASLLINGKPIALPQEPAPGKRVIEFEINSANLAEIWTRGSILPGVSTAPAAEPAANANLATDTGTAAEQSPSATAAPTATTQPRPSPAGVNRPRPTANTNAAPAATPARTPARTPPPATPQPKPAANSNF